MPRRRVGGSSAGKARARGYSVWRARLRHPTEARSTSPVPLAFGCMTHSPRRPLPTSAQSSMHHVYSVDNAGHCWLGAVRVCGACFLVSSSPSSRRAATQKQARHASVSTLPMPCVLPLTHSNPTHSLYPNTGWVVDASSWPLRPSPPWQVCNTTRGGEQGREGGRGATASGGVGGIGLRCVCPVSVG